jgi:hypothetical protein
LVPLESTSYIHKSLEEEKSSPPHIEDVMTDLEEETSNMLPTFQGYATLNLKDMTPTPKPQWVPMN